MLQSKPNKILHERMDSNLVMQQIKILALVHINKTDLSTLLSQLLSTLFCNFSFFF